MYITHFTGKVRTFYLLLTTSKSCLRAKVGVRVRVRNLVLMVEVRGWRRLYVS